ncbi:related to PPN1 - vacuolar endopolyphosphatase [Melanopsichium pennsylvanicum]|uniref:Related to PPN1 - vacuolar endopolyphosphatase n=2 Tax=Melanopsichium pennsylvanicum TaxID=63383 RepID=A0AAJ4XJI1_9BASI|nr:related to PPN1 - vacuolar endopolyphosphatase [Melanopsichium pennsylvanicum]
MRSSTFTVSAVALLLSNSVLPISAFASQAVLQADPATSFQSISILRKPYGRFLHVTDLHPDPHYKHGSAVAGACHHKKPKPKNPQGKERAGWWGSALTVCDSPPRLVESSLAWASKNLLSPSPASSSSNASATGHNSGLDFIIWTGDSARHDNDDKLPRSSKEIFELNRWTLSQLETAFPGVPLIPTVGNNDIFPHNILFPGPNAVTKEYVSIWQDHIPEYEFHTFEQGGYYVKEILPNRLAAMSLNTLYFYDNNKAVDGCVKTKKRSKEVDPGTAQLDWLEVQLELFRKRGMQVHVLGHVPPTAGNYFARCYDRYTDIVLRYQDTVVGQHFGHMNTDAFFIQEDAEAVYNDNVEGVAEMERVATASEKEEAGEVHIEEDGLPGDLKQDYSTLPGKGRTNEDYYSVFYIAPSIIPTYYPSIRLWTYNTTEQTKYTSAFTSNTAPSLDEEEDNEEDSFDASDEDLEHDGDDDDHQDGDNPFENLSRHHHRPAPPKKRKKHKKKKHHKLPRHSSADSPSRTNRYLSLLGYSQWVMDIDEQNEAVEKILHGSDDKLASVHVGGVEDEKKDKKKKKKHDKEDNDKDKEERKKREKEAEKMQVSYRLEYATYPPEVLWAEYNPASTTGTQAPVPKSLLEKELKRAGLSHPYSTKASDDGDDENDDKEEEDDEDEVEEERSKGQGKEKNKKKLAKPLRKFTDYSLESATIGEMMDLARKLMVDKKLWKRFKKRIYSESGYKP